MEDSNKMEVEKSDPELKRLGFPRLIAINALMCLSSVYDYAKMSSRPLKQAVEAAEGAVRAAVGPFYEKFKGVPSNVLVFLDEKADVLAAKFDQQAPPSAKHVVSYAESYIEKALEFAQTVVNEAQAKGPSAAINYARALYLQFISNLLLNFWYTANEFPPVHAVGQIVIPTLAHWTDKYNKTIVDMRAKGYSVFALFPQVPIGDMAKAYERVEAEKAHKQVEAEKGHELATCADE